jgi:hypothetical protein
MRTQVQTLLESRRLRRIQQSRRIGICDQSE